LAGFGVFLIQVEKNLENCTVKKGSF